MESDLAKLVNKKSIALIIAVFIITISLGISLYHAENIPLLDDYLLCLDFLSQYESAESAIDRILMVFNFRNGHPTVTQNLMFLLDWKLFGQVNFLHFILLNNLVHISLILVLYKIFRCYSTDWLLFLPILMLFAVPVFTLNNWSSSFIHLATLLFSLGAMLLLAKDSKFVWALALAIFAAISSGSGILIFAAGLPFLVRQQSRPLLVAWLSTAGFLIIWYLFNYLSFADQNQPDISKGVDVSVYLVNFVVFFGAVFKSLYSDHHIWGAIFGLLITIVLATLIIKYFKILLNDPILLSGLIFALLISVMTTVMRSQFGIGATTAYRYRFYQMVPLVFLYFFFLSIYKVNRGSLMALIFVFSFLLFGLRLEDAISEFRRRSVQLRNGMNVYALSGDPSQLTSRHPEHAAAAIAKAQSQNIYDPEPFHLPLPKIDVFGTYSPQMTIVYDRKEWNERYLYLQGWTFLNANSVPDTEIRVGLKMDGRIYHYPTSARIGHQDPMPGPSLSFSFICPANQMHTSHKIEGVYILIYHSLQGILACKEVEFESD